MTIFPVLFPFTIVRLLWFSAGFFSVYAEVFKRIPFSKAE